MYDVMQATIDALHHQLRDQLRHAQQQVCHSMYDDVT
jgi:hypothetical protein